MNRFRISSGTGDRKTNGLAAATFVTAAMAFGVIGVTAGESSVSGERASSPRGERAPGLLTQQRLVAATGATSGVTQARRALQTATSRVPNSRPYDLETERHRGQPVWEIKVASTTRQANEMYVSADGRRIVRNPQRIRFDGDARRVLEARVSLASALPTAASRAAGRLSEAEIERTWRGVLVWEVEFRRSGDRETEVVVNANTGVVIAVRAG